MRSPLLGQGDSSAASARSVDSYNRGYAPPAPGWFLVWLACVAVAGGAVYGMNVAASSYLDAVKDKFKLEEGGEALVSSAATITDAAAMLVVGACFLDKWGRRNTVVLAALFNVLGCLVGSTAGADNFGWLVGGRLLQGVGNGLCILAVPMLVSESVPLYRRGLLVTFFQVGVVVGFALPFVVQLSAENWQLTFACGGVPGAALLLLILPMWKRAESKAWQAAMREQQETEDSLDSLDSDRQGGIVSFAKGSMLAVLLAFCNNSSDAIVFYGPQILQKAGVSLRSSLWTAFALAAVNIPFAAVVLLLVPRFNRRTLLLGGLFCIIMSYLVIGVCFCVNSSGLYALVIVMFLVLMIAFQAGPGTLFVVVLPELFPQARRASGMAFGTVSMSLFSIVCNGTLPATINALGPGLAFLAYAVAYSLCLLLLFLHLPESSDVCMTRPVNIHRRSSFALSA